MNGVNQNTGTDVAQAKLVYVIRSQVNLHTLRNLHVIRQRMGDF